MVKKQSVKDLKRKVDNFIGHEEFKKELMGWIELRGDFKREKLDIREKRNKESQNKFPYNYIFSAYPGSGITSALELMSQVYFNLNFVMGEEHKETILGEEKDRGFFIIRGNEPVIEAMIIDDYEKFNKLELDEFANEENIYVFVIDPKNKNYKKILKKLKSFYICKHIEFERFSEKELFAILEKNLSEYNFKLSGNAKKQCKKFISSKEDPDARVVEKISKHILINEISSIVDSNNEIHIIENIDLDLLEDEEKNVEETIEKHISGKEELDQLVGLDGIKEQINSIVGQIFINKKKQEKGLIDENQLGSMHMNFYGNPGTGKTSVARIIGKIMKEEGLLKKGDFIEVGREDLVAEYVGQTAIKTSKVLKEALDSVLFIDEAYSLNGKAKYDYGSEALDTIVRHMENHKDRSVIIFAGYNDEMEELFNLNPGLKSRVPFKIEFKNYSENQMLDIFKLMAKDKYIFNKTFEIELLCFFKKAKEYYDKDFSNGRFVRNVYEMIILNQGTRLIKEEKYDKANLRKLKVKDLLAIYQDDEYGKILGFNEKENRRIGFVV